MQEETLGGSTQKEGDTKEGQALTGCVACLRLLCPQQPLTLQLSCGSHASVLLFSGKVASAKQGLECMLPSLLPSVCRNLHLLLPA